MKSTISIILILLLNVIGTHSFAQTETVKVEEDLTLSIEDLFDLIQSNTDYQFVYANNVVKDIPKINLSEGSFTVSELLNLKLKNSSITYEFNDDRTIIIKREKQRKKIEQKVKSVTYQNLIVQATIIDSKTQNPIEFANIGFFNKGIGTISNESGFFSLEYNTKDITATEILKISTLGYQTLEITADKLSQYSSSENIIYLDPEPFALKEVFLTNEIRKEIRVGFHRESTEVVGSWQDSLALGGEIATKIKIRKKDTRLLDVKFNVLKNLSDSIKVRVNIYNYSKRYPQEKLVSDNIYHTITARSGQETVNLTPYNIKVDDDIVVSIELVKVYGNKIDFIISGEKNGGASFKRYVSQDKWKRFDVDCINFSVLTSILSKKSKKKNQEEDEEEIETDIAEIQPKVLKKQIPEWNKIYGRLTYQNAPITDVNIIISGSNAGTKTDATGYYELNAKAGDIIQYSHVGFEAVDIVVEDITSELSFELTEKKNTLKEAVVTAVKPKSTILSRAEKANRPFQTAFGEIDPTKSTTSIVFIDGDELNPSAGIDGFGQALDGKAAGIKYDQSSGHIFIRGRFGPAIWDVDGVIFEEPPTFLNPGAVQTVHILKTPGAKYGGIARYGVVVVNTMNPLDTQKQSNEDLFNKDFYEEDAANIADENTLSTTNKSDNRLSAETKKVVFGIVTTENVPLADVNIRILDSPKGTKTNEDGSYGLETRIGDELQFSYVGMHSVTIVVEDVTTEINIDMVSKRNSLDEVVITAKNNKGEVIQRSEKANEKFSTSRGEFDPKRVGYAIGYVDGKEVNQMVYPNLKEMLRGKLSGIHIATSDGKERIFLRGHNSSILQSYPAAFEVDGAFTTEEPIGLDTNQIVSIHLLRSTAATNKYGTLGAGGVIVITTTNADLSNKKNLNGIDPQFTNQNFYENDAVAINGNEIPFNEGIQALQEYNNRAFAYQFYKKNLKESMPLYADHIDIAKYFFLHFKDKPKAIEILIDQAKKYQKNPEILKAVAYNLQAIGAKREAVTTYQQIISKRPNYAQSYRDLANALKENDKFKGAWRYYIEYLDQGHDSQGEGIGKLVYNEMEYLFYNRPNQTQISQQFVPKNETKIDFRDDIRFVVEWNTSEAEFDLEFVSPDKRSYVFEHTLVANQQLITNEKRRGYSSKEFIIDNVETGEWLMNITYFGNKKSVPTYFKVTTYYNWGKPQQRQEINVYKLNQKNQKLQLQKVNKQALVASN